MGLSSIDTCVEDTGGHTPLPKFTLMALCNLHVSLTTAVNLPPVSQQLIKRLNSEHLLFLHFHTLFWKAHALPLNLWRSMRTYRANACSHLSDRKGATSGRAG
jgi:hypothetical protein